jgi:hypothetical protein
MVIPLASHCTKGGKHGPSSTCGMATATVRRGVVSRMGSTTYGNFCLWTGRRS